MAIAFARARYVSRNSGGNAVRSAAYNARAEIAASATNQIFYFRHRGDLEHHEVLLPDGADPILSESAILWNAAEAAEKRKDAQVARELVLALPMDVDVTLEDQVELARSFAVAHFVSKGVAVQLDVHAPHADPGEEQSAGEGANWHAHLLVTTRRVDGAEFETRKARDLNPEVRLVGGRRIVAEGEIWGELWRAHQDRWFVEHGLGVRVDATSALPGDHLGPVRMRGAGNRAVARAEELRTANEAAARDPAAVLAALTRNSATFTERELERYILKHLPEEERVAATVAVLTHPELLVLHNRDTGAAVGRFTTTTVRNQERAALADAAAVLGAGHHRGVAAAAQAAALAGRTLRPEQQEAFEHAAGVGGLKVIEGRAGTGKSYTLGAVRDAYERAGHRVVGLAPTNAVAQDMGKDGFGETGTVHSALFALKNGRTAWDGRTVLVVDEAAMLDSRVTGELLAEARQAGAKVVLAGDDRQLASIERGGLFTELRQRHGAAEITEVTRQKVDWQRQAARDLAEGRFDSAVQAFDKHGAVTWTADQDAARAALVARWTADTAADPGASRFVFAYTNVEVDRLNAELRGVRRDRGELGSPDVVLVTKHGEAAFAVGDRVQFTDTAKKLGIHNGNAGTITGLDAATGQVAVRLDAASGKEGRVVTWSAADGFEGFRHGYAGTIYKGQGKTLDHTYLLHTHHWRAAASYVALTRQRESAQVFVSTETARDAGQLARQMARGEVRAASVAWATLDELAPELRQRAGEGQKAQGTAEAAQQPAGVGIRAGQAAAAAAPSAAQDAAPQPAVAKVAAGQGQAQPVGDWLIPPYVDPSGQGRDSLGRSTGPGEVAAAVAADKAVQREGEARWSYLQGAYKDPHGVRAALDELVKREGWTSAAARLARGPEQLGELRGKVGWLASAAAKQERVNAERAAGALPGSLARIGTAEGWAERAYRGSVEVQRAADAAGIPRLSPAAEAALGAVAAAGEEQVRGAAWRAVQADTPVAAELERFGAAVEQRFGAEGVRAMLRAKGQAGAVTSASVAPEQRPALDRVAQFTATMKQGERADAGLAQREAEREHQGQRRGMRM